MLDDFRPMSLSDVARQLGVDTFEVVRLAVAAKTVPDGLQFTPEHVERLRPLVAKR